MKANSSEKLKFPAQASLLSDSDLVQQKQTRPKYLQSNKSDSLSVLLRWMMRWRRDCWQKLNMNCVSWLQDSSGARNRLSTM